jgi:hypothetical protein
LLIDLMLERPSAGAKSLALLEGSLKMVTGGRMEKAVVPDIRNIKPETTIDSEPLKAAGVTLKLSPPMPKSAFIAETMSLTQTMGALERVDIGVGMGKLADVKIEGDKAMAVEETMGDGKAFLIS